MERLQVILYVRDQATSAVFYARALDRAPRLDVPGMTEFDLGGAVLGLMPEAGIERLLPSVRARGVTGSRAELYLRVADPEGCLSRAVAAGAELLDPVRPRDWGDRAGYCRDPDGHVLAFAINPSG